MIWVRGVDSDFRVENQNFETI